MKRKNKNILLGFDLDKLVKESVKSLFESNDPVETSVVELTKQKEAEAAAKQRKQVSKNSKKKEEGLEEDDDPSQSIEPVKEKPVKVSEDKLPQVDLEKIIEKLNGIRSGKSLKDGETKKSLKGYFQNLNGAERIALYAFLTGLDKVVGGEDGSQVAAPHADPYSIDMEKEKKPEKKSKGEKDPSAEGEVNPIIVGESSNKTQIIALLRRNR